MTFRDKQCNPELDWTGMKFIQFTRETKLSILMHWLALISEPCEAHLIVSITFHTFIFCFLVRIRPGFWFCIWLDEQDGVTLKTERNHTLVREQRSITTKIQYVSNIYSWLSKSLLLWASLYQTFITVESAVPENKCTHTSPTESQQKFQGGGEWQKTKLFDMQTKQFSVRWGVGWECFLGPYNITRNFSWPETVFRISHKKSK